MAKQTKLILGCILFLFSFLNFASAIISESQRLLNWSSCAVNATKQGKEWVINEVTRNDQSPILHVNDQILGVRGLPTNVSFYNPGYDLPLPAGSQLTLIVRCQGVLHEVPVQTYGATIKDWLKSIGAWGVEISFLLTGLIILLMRADDRQAWLLALVLGTFTGVFNFEYGQIPSWLFYSSIFSHVLGYFFLPLFLHFFLTFPRPIPLVSRRPNILWVIYGVFLIFMLPHHLLQRGAQILGWKYPYWLSTLNKILSITDLSLIVIYLILGLFALYLNYRRSDTDDRRKLHIIVVGCGIGFLNLLVIILLEITGIQQRFPYIYQWAQFCSLFTLVLIPISFAYAIIKHQVIPISLIIRRGMRYVLVSRGSVLLEIAIFSVLISSFLTFFFKWLFSFYKPQSLDSLGMTIGAISATVGIIAWQMTRRLHQKFLAPIIDRKFFRQSYDSHQIITGLAESVRTTTEHHVLFEDVASKIQSALQTESVGIFLQDQNSGDYNSSYYCQYSPSSGRSIECSHDFHFAKQSEVVQQLSALKKCLEVTNLPIPDTEEKILQAMKTELLLPLSGKQQMLGFITLGSRLGDLPFSREDEELLMSVASPVAFAIENSLLMERMVSEAKRTQELEAENEARAKELEEARLLQLSMLPRKLPCLPNLDIAAFMKTATEVGGDYYDFHLNNDGRLTIAVGDATGHGLKAGTIVTATKSLFNNLAGLPDITDVFRQSSLALKQMNLRALYMAMTMVKLNGLEMQISLAGMPPVLIYRAGTKQIEEIALRGMPLGSVTNYPYKLVTETLHDGDVVMIMSDGFPERFDETGAMIGFEKAAEILTECAADSAQQIINQFIKYGDEWGGTRPQDDDITFVVFKVGLP